MVSDSKTGYCQSVLIHNTNQKYKYEETFGKRFALTWALLSGEAVQNSRSFLNKGLVFYFDRYYSSVELFRQMLKANTYAVGE